MAYTKKAWAVGVAGGTPITATELNRMEDGISDAISPELAAAVSSQTFSIPNGPSSGIWTDVPSMTLLIPAGIPWSLRVATTITLATTATPPPASPAVSVQLRVVDAATAATYFAYTIWQPQALAASATYIAPISFGAVLDPLALSTTIKLQVQGSWNASGIASYSLYTPVAPLPAVTMEARRR